MDCYCPELPVAWRVSGGTLDRPPLNRCKEAFFHGHLDLIAMTGALEL